MAKPAKNDAATTVQAEEKAKRKMLTPEERIAKIEAELAAAKAKAGDKDRKEQTRLREQIAALSERKAKIDAKIADVKAELAAVDERLGLPVADDNDGTSV